jgi:hypothetical protein
MARAKMSFYDTDFYVIRHLKKQAKYHKIKINITPELIELKRNQLKLTRWIKENN